MVFNPHTNTAFEEAYNRLSTKDKGRIKYIILNGCGIADTTFYNWLKRPDLISRNDRFLIATAFDMEIQELFKTHQL